MDLIKYLNNEIWKFGFGFVVLKLMSVNLGENIEKLNKIDFHTLGQIN